MKLLSISLLLFAGVSFAAQVADLPRSPERAMEEGLWDVAAIRLTEAGSEKNIPPERFQEMRLMLGECLVRTNRPAEALQALDDPSVREHSRASFWAAQALIGQGRVAEAIEKLLVIATDPASPLQAEAAFTTANMQLSLQQPESALSTLALLANSKSASISVTTKLHRASILLDLGKYQEARGLIPQTEVIPSELIPYADLLRGYLLLSEGNPVEAQTIFSVLLADPNEQSVRHYNLAVIGMADAIAMQGDNDAASETLFNSIQSRPENSLLAPMFRRIVAWLPETMLTADHPSLVRLAGWLPKTIPVASGLINLDAGTAVAAWPTANVSLSNLEAYATLTRAIALRRVNTLSARQESELLLRRLQTLAPSHFLIPKSQLTLAGWKLAEKKGEEAFAILDSLRRDAKSPSIRGQAAFTNALEAYRKGEMKTAATLFAEAAELLEGADRESATFNAALALGDKGSASPLTIQNVIPESFEHLETDLKLERALSESSAVNARAMLDEFLKENPHHPRSAEVRLSIAEACLASSPPDLSMAQAQLETIDVSEDSIPATMKGRVALAKLRLMDLSGNIEGAVAFAGKIAEDFPEGSIASDALLILGKTLFREGRYNEARLMLEKVVSSEPETPSSQAALLLAARSAALGATAQSREEALALFDRTMAIDGSLKALALLEKARLLIDLNRLPAAIESLKAAYEKKESDDPSRLPTGLLLAEAIYAHGESAPSSLSEALQIYDSLLRLTRENLPSYFRIQYLRGLTLEKLPDSNDSTKTRLTEARDAYFSVLDRPTDPPPPEWEWFERSGFRLLTLLETEEEWKAAVAIAEKIASFGGPRSEEAATRARQLRLTHFIWED